MLGSLLPVNMYGKPHIGIMPFWESLAKTFLAKEWARLEIQKTFGQSRQDHTRRSDHITPDPQNDYPFR